MDGWTGKEFDFASYVERNLCTLVIAARCGDSQGGGCSILGKTEYFRFLTKGVASDLVRLQGKASWTSILTGTA